MLRFPLPGQSGVECDAIDPSAGLRFASEPWQRRPELNQHLLQQVLAVLSGLREGANDLSQNARVVLEPLVKELFVFRAAHAPVSVA